MRSGWADRGAMAASGPQQKIAQQAASRKCFTVEFREVDHVPP